jgi:glycosyltransferase involved in cell wall biosynthesis
VRVGLLHYSGPPVVGGVESTLAQQARFLATIGMAPCLIVGTGEAFDPRIEVRVLPEIGSRESEVLAVKAGLDGGAAGPRFDTLRAELRGQLRRTTGDLQVLVVHNALSLHKNLALTGALWDLWQDRAWPRLIAWHHDLAWDRPDYRAELHDGEPWDLLRRAWPGVSQVVVSESLRQRWSALTGLPTSAIHVVPPGVDPAAFDRWTEATVRLHAALALERADILLLLPSRVTRRKNIEFAIEVVRAMRQGSGLDVRLLVTGPPGPHNPGNQAYFDELMDLRRELQLESAVHFLYRVEPDEPASLDDATVADLYRVADALLFPSLDEGFGLPLLEAGWARLPIFCSDLPSFRETGGADITRFPVEARPDEVGRILLEFFHKDSVFHLRSRVRREYTWSQLLQRRFLPLLEEVGDA